MAYAELAGLPAHHGLYAASLAPILAALFASSPYLQTGPVALTALLTLGALVPFAELGSPQFVGLAALLALVVGVVRVAVGLLKAGWVSYLMSRPLMAGFTAAAAILILASQIPGALGSDAPAGTVLARGIWAVAHPGTWEWTAVGLASVTVLLILGGRKLHPVVPGVLLAVAGGMAYSVLTDYPGSVVGDVPVGLPPLTASLPWSYLPVLVLPGAVIALVGFAEAASISRMFASEDREHWDASREFLSQGVANLAAGLTGGFPVGGSFSRSSLNRLAGAGSRWSGLVTGASVLLFLPFADLLAPLPTAVLAGIVIAAVYSLFRPRGLIQLWGLSRPQALVGWTTFVLTLALTPHVEEAVLLGMLLAGAIHLWRELRPDVTSRREGDTLHIEPQGVLWFGSAPALDDEILAHLGRQPNVNRVVINCGGLGRIDLTGAYVLAELLEHLTRAGVDVQLADVPEHAARVLKATGAHEEDPGAVEPTGAPAEAGSEGGRV
jgi:SulP family sulfate permease